MSNKLTENDQLELMFPDDYKNGRWIGISSSQEETENASIKLNRQQITKLAEIMEHFKEIRHFTIETDHSSGIGVGLVVKFDLMDVSDW